MAIRFNFCQRPLFVIPILITACFLVTIWLLRRPVTASGSTASHRLRDKERDIAQLTRRVDLWRRLPCWPASICRENAYWRAVGINTPLGAEAIGPRHDFSSNARNTPCGRACLPVAPMTESVSHTSTIQKHPTNKNSYPYSILLGAYMVLSQKPIQCYAKHLYRLLSGRDTGFNVGTV